MENKIATTIEQIDKYREIHGNSQWNISKETGVFLNILTRAMNAKYILEVGTSIGYSALWFAEALQKTNGSITTIESHKERYQQAATHFKMAEATHIVHQIQGHAPEAIPDKQQEYWDIVFLDATKMEHISYWNAIEKSVKTHGIIITDNILSHKQEMESYVSYVKKRQNFNHSTIPMGTGLLLSIKKSP